VQYSTELLLFGHLCPFNSTHRHDTIISQDAKSYIRLYLIVSHNLVTNSHKNTSFTEMSSSAVQRRFLFSYSTHCHQRRRSYGARGHFPNILHNKVK